MPANILIETVEPIPILVVYRTARFDQLSSVIPEACGMVWKHLQTMDLNIHGRNVAVYLRETNDGLDLQVGVEVVDDSCRYLNWNDGLHVSSTPNGDVAHVIHYGDYTKLIDVHRDIVRWSEETGRPLAGPCWEIYGHWNSDPLHLRTDVYYLLT